MATQLATTPKPPVIAGNKLAAFIPQSLDDAWRLSGALAASGMTPKAYGTDQNKIMVGILAGAEVGLTPFVALQSIAVINGTPLMWGDGMLGLVEASGLLEDFKETDDGKEATCWAKRKGRPSPVVNTFSMDDAKTAGLLGKQGPWQQYTKRMRKLRARSFTLRDLFSDVLKGIKSAEEVHDYTPMTGGALPERKPLSAATLLGHDPETGEIGEGPTDDQRGATNDASDEDHATLKKVLARIRTAKTIDVLESNIAAAQSEIDTLPTDMAVEVSTVIAEARASFA